MRTLNQNKFLSLRKEYPFFSYEDFSMQFTEKELVVTFFFNLSDKFFFQPNIKIPLSSCFKSEFLAEKNLKNIIFQIGLVELISYWKASCSPLVIIKPPYLFDEKQLNFWQRLYFNGLGEFFYVNTIDITEKTFMEIEVSSYNKNVKNEILLSDHNIIPVGGGKDSVVTAEILNKEFDNNLCLIVNPRNASISTAIQSGFNEASIIKVFRTIDPTLLKLNDKGFLNGHTPFSAVLAFISTLVATMTGRRNIILSNESSANEATVEGSKINHQYSKSLEFEKDFRNYIIKYISKQYNYFSFLRPLSELQIAKLFSGYKTQYQLFKSCNVGSKSDIWCCKCPKCLFTYIILSPYISIDEISCIYGQNIFDDKEMLGYFKQLIGIEKVKPFECVGTVDEVNSAICLTIQKYLSSDIPLPFLLQYYMTLENYQNFKNTDGENLLNRFENQHFLNSTFLSILKKYV